ncbi:hypothetical protein ES708_26263 [subsurface metagenome]
MDEMFLYAIFALVWFFGTRILISLAVTVPFFSFYPFWPIALLLSQQFYVLFLEKVFSVL